MDPGLPQLWRAYAGAMMWPRAGHVPPQSLPPLRVQAAGVRLEPDAVARYNEVCGFPGTGIATTYPFVRAFPLLVSMLAHRDWPLRLPGLIHLGTEMAALTPLRTDADYAVRCSVGHAVSTERGTEFALTVEFEGDDGVAWSGSNRILARAGRARGSSRAGDLSDGTVAGAFDATVLASRRYARVSGDWNPIHLGVLGARLFGFRRPIAHGMWSLARTLAALGEGQAALVTAEFTAPLLLPSRVEVLREGTTFAARAPGGRILLRGRTA